MQLYAQVTEADMKEGAKMTLLEAGENMVHNPVHTTAARNRTKVNKKETQVIVFARVSSTLQLNAKWCKKASIGRYWT